MIVIAATNRPDVLDPALLRPGRFDRQVVVPLPDIRGREQILKVHMRKVPVAPDVKADIIARGTPGFSGADLANLVNEAALFAARSNKRLVDMDDFEHAKDKIIMGAGAPLDGHARGRAQEHGVPRVGSRGGRAGCCRKTDPVHKVTIIPRGRALGVTMQLPEQDRYSMDREQMLQDIAVLFGGRIAEEIFMHQMTTGASNDFERATEMARAHGHPLGHVATRWARWCTARTRAKCSSAARSRRTRTCPKRRMQKVDAEIRRIIDQQYALARKLIEDNRDKVEVMAKALLEWETIDADQINDIMEGRPPRPPKPPRRLRRTRRRQRPHTGADQRLQRRKPTRVSRVADEARRTSEARYPAFLARRARSGDALRLLQPFTTSRFCVADVRLPSSGR